MPRDMTVAAQTAAAATQGTAMAYLAQLLFGSTVKEYSVTGAGTAGDIKFEPQGNGTTSLVSCATGGLWRFSEGQSLVVAGSDSNDATYKISRVIDDYKLVVEGVMTLEDESDAVLTVADLADTAIWWFAKGWYDYTVVQERIWVETSIDEGRNWSRCYIGKPIPGIQGGESYDNRKLLLRQVWMGLPLGVEDLKLQSVTVTVNYESGTAVTRTENTDAEWNAGSMYGLHVEGNTVWPSMAPALNFPASGSEPAGLLAANPVLGTSPDYTPGKLCLSWGTLVMSGVIKNLEWATGYTYGFAWDPSVDRTTQKSRAGFAVELRIRTGSDVSSTQMLFGWKTDPMPAPGYKGYFSGQYRGVQAWIQNGKIYVFPSGGGKLVYTVGAPTISTPILFTREILEAAKDYHIIISFNGYGMIRIYVNGITVGVFVLETSYEFHDAHLPIMLGPGGIIWVNKLFLEDSNLVGGHVLHTSGQFYVGCNPLNVGPEGVPITQSYFRGTLISLRLWAKSMPLGDVQRITGRDLTASEIAAAADSGAGNDDDPGLRACWQNLTGGTEKKEDLANSGVPLHVSGNTMETTYSRGWQGVSRRVRLARSDGTQVDGYYQIPTRRSPALSLSSTGNAVYVTNAPFNITWDGNTYLGVGEFAMVEEVQETARPEAMGIRLSLSGVDAANIGLALQQKYHGRPCNLYVVFFDETGALVSDPVPIFAGQIDVMPISHGQDATVSVTAESRFIEWRRAKVIRWNHEVQQQRFLGDKGFEFLAKTTNLEVWWPRTTATGAPIE